MDRITLTGVAQRTVTRPLAQGFVAPAVLPGLSAGKGLPPTAGNE